MSRLHVTCEYPADIMNRLCTTPTCTSEATVTLTYDYDGQAAAIGPLAPMSAQTGYDLCDRHASRFTVPAGWTLLRHVESSGEF
jgi:Protein of unknown function (DUF3499)